MVNPVLIIALPLLIAFLMPLFNYIHKKLPAVIALLTAAFNVWIITVNFNEALFNPMVIEIGNWQAPFAINLYLGPLAILAVAVINVIALVLAIYNLEHDYEINDKFYSLFLMIIAGTSGMVMTGDLFNLFVFIEISSVAAYGLTVFSRGDSYEAAFKYIIIGAIGSVFLLMAIGFTYASVGSLNMAQIANATENLSPQLMRIITLLFMIGIGIEAELFPLNLWVPDVYSEAPTSVTSILSGAVSAAGIYSLGRIFFTLFADPALYTYLMVIGIITLIIGELVAYNQENIKRMLAYSSIAQMGLIVTIISINTSQAVSAGLFQLVNHSILKVLLFISAGVLVSAAGSKKIKDLSGLGSKKPIASLGFAVGAMGILGVPFFNGFVSKLMLINSSLSAEKIIITALILFATIVEIGYYLKVIQKIYFEKRETKVFNTANIFIPVLVLTVFVFALGIYPELITTTLDRAANELLNSTEYITTVLGGM
uniref:NADH dehydrogenase (Quinone) n=1 Tax=uncultured organism TaxID=155900 RepID=M1P1F7_9ZZZZ|nr:NADH dehydrogenase (quinone) [uncultured organism]